ncbi:uncharacterized protein DS421_13g419620 [Arachis hypogaea]|nr:uncharacterized protein DS421_13g419620 [Arachis hypogaea]
MGENWIFSEFNKFTTRCCFFCNDSRIFERFVQISIMVGMPPNQVLFSKPMFLQ